MLLSPYLLILLLLLGSAAVTYLVLPKIIGVVKYKSLMEDTNVRSSHTDKTPSLGGIAFFIVLLLAPFFVKQLDENGVYNAMVPGLLILFIIGLKDDLVILSPLTKIIAQILACSFILFHPDFHILELNGFLGVDNISLYLSIPLAGFLMLTIINAFNLIDGIDGLASIVGLVIFSVFMLLFCLLGYYYMAAICAILIGSLAAFLRFNLSSTKKIFMGDTGSMIIGFVIAAMVIRIFAAGHSELKFLPFQLENLPMIVMAILIVPFFDTARVFTIRILNKRGPFSPDRNHIHHILIDYIKLTHGQASILLGIVNVLFVGVFILLGANFDNISLLIVMILSIFALVYLFYRINFSYKNLRRRLLMRNRFRAWKKKALFKR